MKLNELGESIGTLEEREDAEVTDFTMLFGSNQKKRLLKTFGEISKSAKIAQSATQSGNGKVLTLSLRTMKIGMKLITKIIQDKG